MKMSPLSTLMILTSLLGISNSMSIVPGGSDEMVQMEMDAIKDDGSCAIPSDLDLVRLLTESEDAIFAYIQDDITEQQTKEEPKENGKNRTLDLHCPVGEPLPKSAPIRLRSVCPWEIVDDFDSNRYPKTLEKAVCRCTNCLEGKTNQLNENLSCAPVYYPMPVLRRAGCKDGVATFKPGFEQVAVACDCRAKKTRQGHAI